MRFIALPCLALALTWCWPHESVAADAEDVLPPWAASLTKAPDVADRVVQRRKYDLNHEIDVMAGAFVSNPFFKGVAGTLGYTLHINEFLAWEVLSATYSHDFDTNLKQQFLLIASIEKKTPPPLPDLTAVAASNIVLKPFYGKQALRDVALAHFELYLLAGPAGVLVNNLGNTGYGFGADWGLGVRVWINDVLSVRTQIGQVIYYFSGGVFGEFLAQGGVSLNLGGED